MLSAQTIMDRVDAMLKAHREAKQIRCPACGYTFDMEDMLDLITYWGEDGPKDKECPSCEQKLRVTECVERTYEVEVVEPAQPKGDEGNV